MDTRLKVLELKLMLVSFTTHETHSTIIEAATDCNEKKKVVDDRRCLLVFPSGVALMLPYGRSNLSKIGRRKMIMVIILAAAIYELFIRSYADICYGFSLDQ
ncbi:hypothetical protein Tco_1444014 [Tanacetum coccineum]